jgi:hypothetical protein
MAEHRRGTTAGNGTAELPQFWASGSFVVAFSKLPAFTDTAH